MAPRIAEPTNYCTMLLSGARLRSFSAVVFAVAATLQLTSPPKPVRSHRENGSMKRENAVCESYLRPLNNNTHQQAGYTARTAKTAEFPRS